MSELAGKHSYRVHDQGEIKAMKSGKAPGVDPIHAEMLRAVLVTATSVLLDLFRSIWESDTIPSD